MISSLLFRFARRSMLQVSSHIHRFRPHCLSQYISSSLLFKNPLPVIRSTYDVFTAFQISLFRRFRFPRRHHTGSAQGGSDVIQDSLGDAHGTSVMVVISIFFVVRSTGSSNIHKFRRHCFSNARAVYHRSKK